MLYAGMGENRSEIGVIGREECPECGRMSSFTVYCHYVYANLIVVFSCIVGREYVMVRDCCRHSIPLERARARELFPLDRIPLMRKWGWLITLTVLGMLYASICYEWIPYLF